MRPTLNQLKHKPTIQTCLALKWPLLGMPLIGYGVAYTQGAMIAGAELVGMITAVASFWVFAQIRWAFYKRSQRRLSALCPHCKNLLEGRKVCGKCKNELYPYNYVKGILLLGLCPSCSTELLPGSKIDHCFIKNCKGHPKLYKFAGRTGRLVLMILRAFSSNYIVRSERMEVTMLAIDWLSFSISAGSGAVLLIIVQFYS